MPFDPLMSFIRKKSRISEKTRMNLLLHNLPEKVETHNETEMKKMLSISEYRIRLHSQWSNNHGPAQLCQQRPKVAEIEVIRKDESRKLGIKNKF